MGSPVTAEVTEEVLTRTWAGRLRHTTIEDVPDDEEEEEPEESEPLEDRASQDEDYDEEFWNEYIDEVMAVERSWCG